MIYLTALFALLTVACSHTSHQRAPNADFSSKLESGEDDPFLSCMFTTTNFEGKPLYSQPFVSIGRGSAGHIYEAKIPGRATVTFGHANGRLFEFPWANRVDNLAPTPGYFFIEIEWNNGQMEWNNGQRVRQWSTPEEPGGFGPARPGTMREAYSWATDAAGRLRGQINVLDHQEGEGPKKWRNNDENIFLVVETWLRQVSSISCGNAF